MLALADNTTGVGLDDSYAELTHNAFAVWVRLHTLLRPQLAIGVAPLAKLLDIDRSTFSRHLRELRRKGYVRTVTERERNSFKTRIVLTRRAILPTPSEFLRL